MCKCAWLKKLLGLKKECCCHSADKNPITPATPVQEEKTANQQ